MYDIILATINNFTFMEALCCLDFFAFVRVCYYTGYQIEPFDNPADFFMDITNGEAKSTSETPAAGTPTQEFRVHDTDRGTKHGFR